MQTVVSLTLACSSLQNYFDKMLPLVCVPIATAEQLQQLKGIGETKAKAIIDYRVVNPCPTIRELSEVTNITESVWSEWEDKGIIALSVSSEICADATNLHLLLDTFHEIAVYHHDCKKRLKLFETRSSDLAQAEKTCAEKIVALEASHAKQIKAVEVERDSYLEQFRKADAIRSDLQGELNVKNKQLCAYEDQLTDLRYKMGSLEEMIHEKSSENEFQIRQELDRLNFEWQNKLSDCHKSKEFEIHKHLRQISSLEREIEHLKVMRAQEQEHFQKELDNAHQISRNGREGKGEGDDVDPFFRNINRVMPPRGRYSKRGVHTGRFIQPPSDDRVYSGVPFHPTDNVRTSSRLSFMSLPKHPSEPQVLEYDMSKSFNDPYRAESPRFHHDQEFHRFEGDPYVSPPRNEGSQGHPESVHSKDRQESRHQGSRHRSDDRSRQKSSDRSRRRSSDRSISNSSCVSSSEDSDSSVDSKHRRHRRRSRSPPLPKMSSYSGEGKVSWESFIFQFERIAERRHWGSTRRLDRLIDCLSGVALEYANKLSGNLNYRKFKHEMKRRFSLKDAPVAARRKLQYVRQKEDESIEQFSQRVHFLTLDAYEDAGSKTIHQMAVEAFLRGCKEKEAARAAMEKEPSSIHKALKYVKASIANQRAIFGARPSYSHRQVTFSEPDCDVTRDDSLEIRNVSKAQSDDLTSSTKQLGELKSMLGDLTKALKEGFSNRRFSRSPSPSRSPQGIVCFGCRQKGHIEKECPNKQKMGAVGEKSHRSDDNSPSRPLNS